MQRGNLTSEQILSWLNDLDEEKDTDVIDKINNCNSISVTLFPPDDGAVTDCDDGNEDEFCVINDVGQGILTKPCEVKLGALVVNSVPEDSVATCSRETKTNNFGKISTSSKKKKILKTRKWKTIDLKHSSSSGSNFEDHNPDIVQKIIQEDYTPIDLFREVFDAEFMQFIRTETIKYASSKGENLCDLTIEELYKYLGILLLSGYSKVPATRMYWETESDVHNHLVASSMSRHRFERIHRFLHFNDNSVIDTSDKTYKIKPLLDHVNLKFQQLAKPFPKSFSLDEAMEPYFGKHSIKQFIRGKPIRYGFKFWCLTTIQGFLLRFSLYTGKGDSCSSEPLGMSVTKKLCNQLVPLNSTIYLDNYFNSLQLLEEFSDRNQTIIGTIRNDRIEKAPLTDMKKSKRGAYEALNEKNITLIRWNDNNKVTMATNCTDKEIVETLSTCLRWDYNQKKKININQPSIFKKYNAGMGGVDLFDQQRAVYRTRIRSKKWYWPIFRFCLNGTIVNLWILYRKAHKNVTLIVFLRRLVKSLLSSPAAFHPTVSLKRKKSTDIRYDGLEHYVNSNKTQRRCGYCGKCAKFICMKCNVGLHPDTCFYKYHTMK